MGKPAIAMLHSIASKRRGTEIDLRLRRALLWLKDRVSNAEPRRVDTRGEQRPVLIFSDGAAEPGLVSCGAFILDSASNQSSYFGLEIADEVVRVWSKGGKSQVIGQAELYPIALIRIMFGAKLRGRRELPLIPGLQGFNQSPMQETIRLASSFTK